jgi:hypothetical protein
LHLDSLVPVMISTLISFYAMLNFTASGTWYQQCYAVAMPVWIIYFSGMLRVMIAYCEWSKW